MRHVLRPERLTVALFTVLAACAAPAVDLPDDELEDLFAIGETPSDNPIALANLPRVSSRRAATVDQVQRTAIGRGAYRIHNIDVGTGLSMLVEGSDFRLLFDAGSGDDNGSITRAGNGARVIAYLFAALGPSGPADCRPTGDARWATYRGDARVRIDHLVQSHPHLDHGSMIDEVLHCYDVRHFWDSGAMNDTAFYRDLMAKVAMEPGLTYHTAREPSADRRLSIGNTSFDLSNVTWQRFIDSEHVELGVGASFTILHADAQDHSDVNDNSIVMRVDLGRTSLLLVGDAESGPRVAPSSPVGATEELLLQRHRAMIDVDILQVGHHGSLTSSRTEFIRAVSPRVGLIGVGPKQYGSVVLPDAATIMNLEGLGVRLFRSDTRDRAGCDARDRIGIDDGRPGGCDNTILEIAAAR